MVTPWNLSPLVAKRIASWAWSSPRMFTAKRAEALTAWPVDEDLLRQMRTIGGSSDRELTALAVVPNGRSSCSAVMTVTPLAKCPMTSRNSLGVIWRRSFAAGAVVLMPSLLVLDGGDSFPAARRGQRTGG